MNKPTSISTTHSLLLAIGMLFLASQTKGHAQSVGCTDVLATNYDPNADVNDGSCLYNNVTVSPEFSANLPAQVDETSGLTLWNGLLWTHNDDTDKNLYALDTLTGNIVSTVLLNGTVNRDWEDIDQDEQYIYLGDFGNNSNGNRTDLNILRIAKSSLLSGNPELDTIYFSYPDQTDLSQAGNNNTDFDCEALIARGDSLYLFTKQWVSEQTTGYSLPKVPGTYVANKLGTLPVNGLVTGATTLPDKNLMVLSGYSSTLQPFIYLLYDFNVATGLFSGNKRKLTLGLNLHQIEGITTQDGLRYYLSNEYFTRTILGFPFTSEQKMHLVNLSDYLQHFLYPEPLGIPDLTVETTEPLRLYPNPTAQTLTLESHFEAYPVYFFITDLTGRMVLSGEISKPTQLIDIASLQPGTFVFHTGGDTPHSLLFMKQ